MPSGVFEPDLMFLCRPDELEFDLFPPCMFKNSESKMEQNSSLLAVAAEPSGL